MEHNISEQLTGVGDALVLIYKAVNRIQTDINALSSRISNLEDKCNKLSAISGDVVINTNNIIADIEHVINSNTEQKEQLDIIQHTLRMSRSPIMNVRR